MVPEINLKVAFSCTIPATDEIFNAQVNFLCMYFFWVYNRSVLLQGFSFSPQSLHQWQPKSSLQAVNLEATRENGMLKEAFVVFFHGDSS